MQTAHPGATTASFPDPGGEIPSLVVSLHDVSTVTRRRSERMLCDLAECGVGIASLLVIPDHHGRGRIDEDPDFVSWLRGTLSRGHEAVLHGYRHERPFRGGENLRDRLITRSYTAGEGEFYDLGREEASALLRRGREALRACGAEPHGFIAPAWLLGREAEMAVREEGFDYTTLITGVKDLARGRFRSSRSLVYSVRSPWRVATSLAWNALLFERLAGAPLLRVSLHPPDWDHPPVKRQILALLGRAASERRVTTYRQWLDQWRSSGHEGV